MTSDEKYLLAWNAFAVTFTREAHLPPDERGKAALRAAERVRRADPEKAGVRAAIETRDRRPAVPNDISEERARKIISAIALKHDTTSADIRSSSQDAATVEAREEAAAELVRAGLSMRAVARLLGRARGQTVGEYVERHEARVAERAGRKEMARGA